MKQQELSAQLQATGRPLTASGISRIEQGERRVDVDDLVALALSLGVTPNRILLSDDASENPIHLAPEVSVTRSHAWRWASGEDEILLEDDGPRRRRFPDLATITANRPHRPLPRMGMQDVLQHAAELAAVAKAVKALEEVGLTRQDVFEGLALLDMIAATQQKLDESNE